MTPRDAFTDEEFKETYNNTDSRNATCLYTHLFFTSALPEYLQAHFLEFKSERAPLMEMYKLVFAKMYNVINEYEGTYETKVNKFKEKIKRINEYSHLFTDEIYPGRAATSIMPNRARLKNRLENIRRDRESQSGSYSLGYYSILLAAKLIKLDTTTPEGFRYDNEYVKAFTNLTGEIRIPFTKFESLQGGKRTRKRKNTRSNRKYSRRR
ncbi:hypothetical protein EBR66_05120 [bacterium]|nr:hypothetical protein [bacterium]